MLYFVWVVRCVLLFVVWLWFVVFFFEIVLLFLVWIRVFHLLRCYLFLVARYKFISLLFCVICVIFLIFFCSFLERCARWYVSFAVLALLLALLYRFSFQRPCLLLFFLFFCCFSLLLSLFFSFSALLPSCSLFFLSLRLTFLALPSSRSLSLLSHSPSPFLPPSSPFSYSIDRTALVSRAAAGHSCTARTVGRMLRSNVPSDERSMEYASLAYFWMSVLLRPRCSSIVIIKRSLVDQMCERRRIAAGRWRERHESCKSTCRTKC